MTGKWRKTFSLYGGLSIFKNKVEQAEIMINDVLRNYNKPYIAFSGGKDSTCMLHLILEQNPDIMVLYWDYGKYYIPRKINCEIKENAKKLGAKNLRVETSIKYEKLKRQAKNILGEDLIKGLLPRLKDERYDASFIGLRKEESLKRKIRIQAGRSLSEIKEIFPIADWTWMDVWAYIISNHLPYLSHYDLYGPIIGWNKVRMTTFFDPEFDKYGCSNIDGVLMWKYRIK